MPLSSSISSTSVSSSASNASASSDQTVVPSQRQQERQYDCPILIWMLSFNREYSPEEYDDCYNVVQQCVPHAKIKYQPENADTFRQLMMHMLPLLMMRHRRIPRAKWKDCVTPHGKHWIEQSPEDMAPNKFLHSMIGYHLSVDTSICGMAMTQGMQKRVVNIGLGIKRLAVEPKGVSVADYVRSQSHKLTQEEQSFVKLEFGDEVMLRRLCILLALKQAYLGAIGQPIGFDYSRLSFNIDEQRASGDGLPLQGWEFRVYMAELGVSRREKLVEDSYECVGAFFRGTVETKFIFYENREQLDSWVQFLNVDQMVKVIPKLTA
ncbi:hypothetical protein DL96DRAFT_870400 [Flagelloscypha sp. PMI_526]|nr:hypothetical protein DL96DRAFT_870400 [Flagelloscypha sp. PMI_526]